MKSEKKESRLRWGNTERRNVKNAAIIMMELERNVKYES